ncbi:DEKNAAC100306 [Brettanomyces naardenensis]|uniref:Acyl-coenzyme A oxidase n=1 Tax=Brettanomyces naardenensis TaxID=13370 RepID=A0A448YET9_BRENA|nr:DEKNAAC100306 [Brettanomyces naardenensis]
MSSTTLPGSQEPNPSQMIWSERLKTDFDLNKMHTFLEGSEHDSLETLRIMQQLERDPILRTTAHYYEYDKLKHREQTALKIGRLAQYIETDAPDFQTFQNRLNLIAIVDPQLGTRIGVHLGLFLGAIKGNGTEEQFNYWAYERGSIYLRDIYGCFSMTELAHGSNVAGLETTATYNKERRIFTINTPNIGATKWWIGGAAHSSTHTVCFARLIVDGKDYGVKTFVVPLRDANHDLHHGITIGDIGQKMGRNGIDNGWIQFTNVEIPKEYMLSKFTTVEEDGTVVEPPLAQLAYGALLGGRVTMVTDSFRTSERFITIALRYSVGRRQFKSKGKKVENQLINYPLHQRRLLPFLAWTYAMSVASYQIQSDYKTVLQQLDEGAKTEDFKVLSAAIDGLKGIFADSASLKSTCTWKCSTLIDECRQSCGGHGYSSYSGFAKGFVDHAVQCTWEGDNNVLAQNSGRITIQNVIKYKKDGKKPKGNYSFLLGASKDGYVLDSSNLHNLDDLVKAFDSLILRLALDSIEKLQKNGHDWDAIAAEKLSLSKLYAVRYMLYKWCQKLKLVQQSGSDGGITRPLVNLAILFALSNVESFGDRFLEFGILSPSAYKELGEAVDKVLVKIRPDVIGLTDAFKLSDFFINSVLGSYNGDIYNDYLGTIKSLNDTQVTKAPYTKALEGMLNRGSVASREKNEKSPEVLKKLSS